MKFIRLCAAMLAALPAAALAQGAGKPVVAIYQMDDVANSGQAQAFSAMIETAIASTSKFRVVERERLKTLVGEQARAKSGLVRSNKPGKVGGFEGADYLIYGSITTVSVTNKENLGASFLGNVLSGDRNSNVSCSNSIVTLGVDIKITDADSGEVKYVSRISEKKKSEASCQGNAQVDAGALLRSAAEKVATELVTAIYPIQVAAVQGDGVFVLNYGEGTVQPGQVFGIYTKGVAIMDPATGEPIGHDEQKLGFIRVTDVNGRISKAVAQAPLSASPPVGAIVRPASAADLKILANPKKKK
ncbi:MAG TPA: CsgG/HfaB family protein [Allosphingosinicella sp.]|jgi:curli biogenesis system outer membrane secretion channel CsgG